MYRCVFILVFVYTCIYIYICLYAHINQTNICIHTYILIYEYAYIYIYIHVYIYIYMYIYIYIQNMYCCIYVYVYIYTCTYACVLQRRTPFVLHVRHPAVHEQHRSRFFSRNKAAARAVNPDRTMNAVLTGSQLGGRTMNMLCTARSLEKAWCWSSEHGAVSE